MRMPLCLLPLVLVLVTAQAAQAQIKTKADFLPPAAARVQHMSVQELKAEMDNGRDFVLVDVRTERERDAGFISGSVWIPRGVLEFKIQEVCPDPDTQIIVYCRKGGRSTLAAATLQDLGYANVFNLDGGVNAWGEQGYPLYNWHGEIRVTGFDAPDPCRSDYDIFKK